MELSELFLPNSIVPGFYVGEGAETLIPEIKSQVTSWLRRDFYLPAFKNARASTFIQSLHWIDSMGSSSNELLNWFGACTGIEQKRLKKVLHIENPSTVSDLIHRMASVSPATTLSINRKSPMTGIPVVVFTDLMAPFYSLSTREGDAHRALHNFVLMLSELKERAMVIGLIKDRLVPFDRRYFLPQVLRWSHERIHVTAPALTAANL